MGEVLRRKVTGQAPLADCCWLLQENDCVCMKSTDGALVTAETAETTAYYPDMGDKRGTFWMHIYSASAYLFAYLFLVNWYQLEVAEMQCQGCRHRTDIQRLLQLTEGGKPYRDTVAKTWGRLVSGTCWILE